MNVPVYNMQGQAVGSMTIDDGALGGSVNPALIKQAYVMYHSNTRQGSSRTKNREAVEGSTRKIYKQKGTGNARHADRKANLFKGGGHGHSKKRTREDYHLDMPKKMRRKANRNALLAKLVDQEVRVIDAISFTEPKTKGFRTFLDAIKVDRSALVALSGEGESSRNARLSARNVEDVTLIRADQLNTFALLNHRYLVIGKGELEAWLTGPTSQTGKSAKVSPLGAAKNGEARYMPAKIHATHIIKKPLLTEKVTFGMNEQHRYAFLVDRRATKVEIKSAVEGIYKVRVLGVNTQVRKGRGRRLKAGLIIEPETKKATVRLHPDDKIELF